MAETMTHEVTKLADDVAAVLRAVGERLGNFPGRTIEMNWLGGKYHGVVFRRAAAMLEDAGFTCLVTDAPPYNWNPNLAVGEHEIIPMGRFVVTMTEQAWDRRMQMRMDWGMQRCPAT